MSWGTRRRNRVIVIIFLVILIIAGIKVVDVLTVPATCFDGKQNGKESGLDCGGDCTAICSHQVIKPLIHWVREFEVVPGLYNVVAYVENQNIDAGSEGVEYIFKLYNSNNIILTERIGRIDLRPREIIPIIESNLDTGKLLATRATFEFTNEIDWQRRPARERVLVISDERMFDVDGLPRITAELTNTSIRRIEDVTVAVIVYDIEGNALTTSSTLVKSLGKDETVDLIYTWPQEFSATSTRFEMVPLYETE